MKVFLNLFVFSIALCIITQGMGAPCKPLDIKVQQARTGVIVEGKPEYKVTLRNTCNCVQSKVTIRCYGLSSVEQVNFRAIKPIDEEKCVVNSGRPLGKGAAITFKYAWMTPQDFPIISSEVHC